MSNTYTKARSAKKSSARAIEKSTERNNVQVLKQRTQQIKASHLKNFENHVGIELYYNRECKMTYVCPIGNIKSVIDYVHKGLITKSPEDFALQLNASKIIEGKATQIEYAIGYNLLAAAMAEKHQGDIEELSDKSWLIWVTDDVHKLKVEIAGIPHKEWLVLTHNNIIN